MPTGSQEYWDQEIILSRAQDSSNFGVLLLGRISCVKIFTCFSEGNTVVMFQFFNITNLNKNLNKSCEFNAVSIYFWGL